MSKDSGDLVIEKDRESSESDIDVHIEIYDTESDVVIELCDMDYADSNQRQLFLGLQFHGETSTDSESDDQRITFNGRQFIFEQESESDYYASNDETDSEMVFEMDTNDMTD